VRVLRAAVIGLGVGARHAQAYQEIPGVEVAALCDTDRERLDEMGGRHPGAKRTTDWRDVVADGDIDIVSICTPDHMHFEQAAALVRAGKHVLCEKPMVMGVEQARELVELVFEHGVIFSVGNVCRFVPQFAAAIDYARQGKLGDLFAVEADYIHDMREVFARTSWRVDPEHPQNAIFGGGVHPIDLLQQAAGEVVEVFAYGNHKVLPEYHELDNILISLKFASGCIGKVWVTFGVRQQPHNRINLNFYGSKGSVLTDSQHAEVKLYLEGMDSAGSGWATIPLERQEGHPFRAELERFVDCVRNKRPPAVSVVSGARTVAVMSAARASLESGRPEAVPGVPVPRHLCMIRPSLDDLPPLVLPAGYGLRTFRDGDEEHWLRICRPEFGRYWTADLLHEQILDKPWFAPEHMFFVTRQGEPVGVACAWQRSADPEGTGSVHYIGLSPEHRGKGLGRVLMAAVLRCLRERGFERCDLLTEDFRWPAIGLYWKLGFRPMIGDELDRRRWKNIKHRLNLR